MSDLEDTLERASLELEMANQLQDPKFVNALANLLREGSFTLPFQQHFLNSPALVENGDYALSANQVLSAYGIAVGHTLRQILDVAISLAQETEGFKHLNRPGIEAECFNAFVTALFCTAAAGASDAD